MSQTTTAPNLNVALSAPPPRAPANSAIAWYLFLLLNATLFMRPAEVVPQLEGLPIYNCIILACLFFCYATVAHQLRFDVMSKRPITVCVIGILPGVVLSLLHQGETWNAREYGIDFFKVIIYYLLVLANLDSAARLRQFLVAITVYILLLNSIALLNFYHFINLSTVAPMEESQFDLDPITGERVIVVRLVAAGIFGNPNDLSRICGVGILLCIFGLIRYRSWLGRLFWTGTMVVLAHALQLTKSRGGLLSLGAGLVILLYARFGAKRGGVLLLLILPLIVLFSGRQTDINTGHGTAQERIRLWSHGLVAMRESPVFGIGTDHYFNMAGNHAHNSFVESYVEMGFFGGSFFACAFILATVGLWRVKSPRISAENPDLLQLRPFVLSIIVATIISQFSSSREYSLPTYMYLAIAAAYLGLAGRHDPYFVVRVTPRLFGKLLVASACTLVFFHLYTKLNAHF